MQGEPIVKEPKRALTEILRWQEPPSVRASLGLTSKPFAILGASFVALRLALPLVLHPTASLARDLTSAYYVLLLALYVGLLVLALVSKAGARVDYPKPDAAPSDAIAVRIGWSGSGSGLPDQPGWAWLDGGFLKLHCAGFEARLRVTDVRSMDERRDLRLRLPKGFPDVGLSIVSEGRALGTLLEAWRAAPVPNEPPVLPPLRHPHAGAFSWRGLGAWLLLAVELAAGMALVLTTFGLTAPRWAPLHVLGMSLLGGLVPTLLPMLFLVSEYWGPKAHNAAIDRLCQRN